jgi:hypothetical protein
LPKASLNDLRRTYGEAGKHYTKEGKTIKLNLETYTNNVVKQGDFLKIWSFFTQDVQPDVFGWTVVDPRETERDKAIDTFLSSLPLGDYIGTSLVPPDGFDLAGFSKRQSELVSKAIFEDKSGQNWPQYREELTNRMTPIRLLDRSMIRK